MTKLSILMIIVLFLSSGLVPGAAQAGDASAPLKAAAAQPSADGDYGYTPPIGPLAFMMLNGSLYSCYEMFARVTGERISLNGRSAFFNNQALVQAAIGFAVLSGSDLVWGIEGFPNPSLAAAAKIGGLLALATLAGNGYGFHLVVPQIIAFQFLTHVILGACPQQFIAADQ
jgi:hypothetical protein